MFSGDWGTIGIAIWLSLVGALVILVIVVIVIDVRKKRLPVGLTLPPRPGERPKERMPKKRRWIRARVHHWNGSSNSRGIILRNAIPWWRREDGLLRIYWLLWVWAEDIVKDWYEEILEDTEVRDPVEPEMTAPVRRRRRRSQPLSREFRDFFEGGPGFAVFDEASLMVGWAPQSSVFFEMKRDNLDVTTGASAWREFIPGPTEVNVRVSEFHYITHPAQFLDETLTMIMAMPGRENMQYESSVRLTAIEGRLNRDVDQGVARAQFIGVGEMTMRQVL